MEESKIDFHHVKSEREALPIYDRRDEIANLIKQNLVSAFYYS